MIHVFKTDLSSQHVSRIETIMNSIPEIQRWNVDLEDCDKILKVVTEIDLSNEISSSLQKHGFLCEELL